MRGQSGFNSRFGRGGSGIGSNRAGGGFRHSWAFWLAVLGIAAAITLLAPSTISIAMITIIGIPIGLFLLAAPFLFLLVLLAGLISGRIGGGWMGRIAGTVGALAILAVPPFFANRVLDQRAKVLVAQDIDEGGKPQGKIIGVRSDRFRGKGKGILNCDGFCQRALLNGVAERVLVIEQDLNLAIDPTAMADSFRLERGAACPPVKLPQGHDPVEIRGERQDWQGKRVDELTQLEIAKGNCLIAETLPLGTADYVLTVGKAHQGKNVIGAGLSLFADTVNADRISMHEKRGGGFAETYRKTFVVTYRLAPFYAPTAEGGSELRMYPALARMRETINISERYYEKPDWTAFVTGRLGLDLALRRDNAREDTRTVLNDALLRTGEEEAVPQQVGTDFFESIQRGGKIDAADYAIARQLLEDERFPVPGAAVTAISYAKEVPAGYFDAIGSAMFKRLRAMAARDDGTKYPAWREEASHIGNVIRHLPASAIADHRDDLEWLAKQDRLRVRAWQALIRFGEFGAEGAARLIWLIDDSNRFRAKHGDDWQHPQLAGLIGLCEMGPAGATAIQPLFDRLDRGEVANWASYHRLVVHGLVRMGARPDDIWLYARERGANAEKDEAKARKRFDREVERALKYKECWY